MFTIRSTQNISQEYELNINDSIKGLLRQHGDIHTNFFVSTLFPQALCVEEEELRSPEEAEVNKIVCL